MSVTIYGSGQIVKQVVVGTYQSTSGFSTSSTSYVATPLAVTITPTSSSNKVLITVSTASYFPSAANAYYTIYRNSTNLATGSAPISLMAQYSASSGTIMPINISFLDSPSTTSATTYTLYVQVTGSTVQVNFSAGGSGSSNATIVAQEISGT